MKKFWFLVGYDFNKRKKGLVISVIIILAISLIITIFSSLVGSGAITIGESAEPTAYDIIYYSEADDFDFESYLTYAQTKLENTKYFINGYKQDNKITDFYTSPSWLLTEMYIEIESTNTSLDDSVIHIYSNRASSIVGIEEIISNTLLEKTFLNNNYFVKNDYNTNFVVPKEEQDYDFTGLVYMIPALPVMLLFITSFALISTDIVQEKMTKAIETILTSISAEQHFFSKILSSILFSLSIGAGALISILLSSLISSVFLPKPDDATLAVVDDTGILQILSGLNLFGGIVVLFITLILGLGLILGLIAFISSLASSQEDMSSLSGPFMLISLLGFYAVVFLPILGDMGISILKVITFFPIFTPYILPGLVMNGTVDILFVILNIAELAVFTGLFFYFILPVYKVSILNYTNGGLIKRVKLSIKETKNRKKALKEYNNTHE